jgi:kynurenine formamidase
MLTDLDQLVQNIVDLTVLPLKIRGCDGSPMRVVAIKE